MSLFSANPWRRPKHLGRNTAFVAGAALAAFFGAKAGKTGRVST